MAGGGVRRGARLLLAALCLASACSDDDVDPAPTTEAKAAEGMLRLGVAGPLELDPAAVNPGSPAELMVADLLHDGLTALAADGSVVPAVAAAWTHDADSATWTFTLADDATFTDGMAITADDVVRTMTRVAAAEPASLAGLRLDAVVGYEELVGGEADELAGVRAPDPNTVEIETTAPLGTLPAMLAAPELGIVAESLEQADQPGTGLPLSGAWELVEATDGHLSLTARPDRGLDLAGVELHRYEDDLEAYEAFDAGQVDWALVPAQRYDHAVEAHGDDHFAPFHAEVFLGLRLAEPLTSEPLRQAIAAAVDRESIVAEVYADVADPLATVVPDGVAGHDPAICDEVAGCRHDLGAAEALVEEAFPDGDVPTVVIDFDESERQQALAEAVAADLDAAGIPTELRPHDRDDYRRFVASGDQQLFSLGWIGGYASPDAYLVPLFVSGGKDNLIGIADPELDLGLVVARAAAVPEAAADAWAEVERRVLAGAVVVPIAQFRTQAVVAPRVQGLAHRVDGTVDWAAVRLADDPAA